MKTLRLLALFLILLKCTSCYNTRQVQYVQGHFDTSLMSQYQIKEPVVQVGDLLSILVFSDNPEATTLYNLSNVAGGTTPGASQVTSGYLVDKSGNIRFQGLGELHVAGLTKDELSRLLDSKLSGKYLMNPYYNIRFLNYRITMLGEVSREGVYSIPHEKINIFEAIGLAGGLNIYARRENVLVVREGSGKREFARLDLTKPEIFQNPYYFLQQNDIIIVDQTRAKSTANDVVVSRNISLVSSIVSMIAIVYSVFRTR